MRQILFYMPFNPLIKKLFRQQQYDVWQKE